MSIPERRAMVERPSENLSVRRQCALLNRKRRSQATALRACFL
jgi:hypothetical protein